MFTWINRAALALPAVLAACVATTGSRTIALGSPAEPGPVIAAPNGYCAAPDSVTQRGGSAFVAFLQCGFGQSPAVLTATLGTSGSAIGIDLSASAVAAYVTSADGRRALSRVGDATTLTVHEVFPADQAVLVRLTDTSPRPIGLGPGASWRAILSLGDRLVTLSVSSGTNAALPDSTGRRLVEAFVTSFRAANSSAG